MMNYMVGGKDEYGELNYNKVPDYVRGSNMVFMLGDGTSKALKVPLPYGYNIFWTLGETMARMGMDPTYSKKDALAHLVRTGISAFNPLGGGESDLLQMLTPTPGRFIADLAKNKSAVDTPIRPPESPHEHHKPDSQRFYQNSTIIARGMAEFMNWMGGQGDKYTGAEWIEMLDTSPDNLDYVAEFWGGGFYNTLLRGARSVIDMYTGDFNAGNLPLIRRFYIGSDPLGNNSYHTKFTYYDNVMKINDAKASQKDRLDDLSPTLIPHMAKTSSYLAMHPYLQKTQKDVADLNKLIAAAKEKGLHNLVRGYKKDQIKIMSTFNMLIREMEEKRLSQE